ncbi:hydrolase [Flavobacterium sp. SM15]|uniref:hydrolase n=1 Tax=Flavobacterium sp. SM15 TaxID=2908005 RepID=UPI001EDB6FE4|nr:hydrolase [Flavobacterium sp. SM15]MCG2611865.1 hydrolase [Flavobacterium sp. SM15]
MKKAILYLFILSLLLNVFQYMNSTKILKTQIKEIENAKAKIQTVRDSSNIYYNNMLDANYFALETNDESINYFSNYDINQLSEKIKSELMAMNDAKEGNRLVPYDPVDGNKFIINKIKILNHRWIIADVYSGNLRGEILIKYFVNENKPTDFETIETILHSKIKIEQ